MFRSSTSIATCHIACPTCGHQQRESLHAIATICQNCNHGIAIFQGSVIVKPPRVTLSRPSATKQLDTPSIKAPSAASAWTRIANSLGLNRQKLAHHATHQSVHCHCCHSPQKLAKGVPDTHCIHCGSYINLRDYEIDNSWQKRIQTRGNVHIKRHASIRGVAIHCHDLLCDGEFHGSLQCTGSLHFRSSAKIIGKITCQHLEVDGHSYIHSTAEIHTHSALIIGQLHGSIIASGGVTLEKTAILHGNIAAANILIRPGAKHSGSITIQKILAPIS